ncbi:hypothetical protein Tco_0641932 [Tanacetum coccineum]
MEDVASYGLFYTWTKNLFKVKASNTSGVLKKLDANKRAFKFSNFVDDNEEFLSLVKLMWEENVDGCQMNNAYFNKVLKSRTHKCRINTIHDGHGNNYEGDDVAEQFVRHFQKFLGEEVQVKHIKNSNMIIKNKLSEAKANEMVDNVSDAEIKEAMFLIDGNKAPNDFSSLLFKRA